jgi:hypothetical protein
MKFLVLLLCLSVALCGFDGWRQTIVSKPLSTYLEDSLPILSILLDTDFSFPLISNVWKEIEHPNHFWMWVEEDSDQYTIFINADNAAGLKVNAKRGHINPGSEVL